LRHIATTESVSLCCPDEKLTDYTQARRPAEEKWYALTGRVVDANVEADGDIHLAVQDADGKNTGTVSAEIPVGEKWCEIRQMVFGWDEAEVSIHGQERARPYNCRARRHCYGQSILRHRTRASRSFKPTTFAERLRCVGNSSGDEN